MKDFQASEINQISSISNKKQKPNSLSSFPECLYCVYRLAQLLVLSACCHLRVWTLLQGSQARITVVAAKPFKELSCLELQRDRCTAKALSRTPAMRQRKGEMNKSSSQPILLRLTCFFSWNQMKSSPGTLSHTITSHATSCSHTD